MSDGPYWKVTVEDNEDYDTAAFEDEGTAKAIASMFTDRYDTEYTVTEADEATTAELMRGTTVAAVENV